MLCLLIIPILGWACWRWLDGRAPPRDVALAVAGLLLCPVVLLGAGQIYADLLSGAVILALAAWLWNDSQAVSMCRSVGVGVPGRSDHPLAGRSSALASRPPALAAHQESRHRRPLRPVRSVADLATSVRGASRGCPPRAGGDTRPAPRYFLLGPATFLWYQFATHGMPLGPVRGTVVTGTPYLRVVEMLLGRHLDQSHGLFWHQPLFFPGLVALGWMIRRRHPLTIPWLLLYASLIVPPGGAPTAGAAPPSAGSTGAAMWLWLIPIGLWLQTERVTPRSQCPSRRCWQRSPIRRSWRSAGCRTRRASSTTRKSPLVWARDSLFPLPVRYILPHFYLDGGEGWWVARYLEYLPNLIWVAAAALLIVTGWMWSAEGRRRLRPVWIGGIAVAALLLPVEPTADAESLTDDGLHIPMVRSIQSTFPRRFEAERMTPMQTADRTTRLDEQASGGPRSHRRRRGDSTA